MKVQYYITEDGNEPVTQWLQRLKDIRAKAQILLRLNNIEEFGRLGNNKSVGGGVYELKFPGKGPGYRIYYGQSGKDIVLLLCAGIKSTQQNDINKAIEYWEEFKHEKKKGK